MPKRILLYASQVKYERSTDEAPLHHGGWGESRVTPPDQVCMRNGHPKIITALNNFPALSLRAMILAASTRFVAGIP